MWKWLKSLFTKKKDHIICDFGFSYGLEVRPKYIHTASIGKGQFKLRYNVYELYICGICGKHIIYKADTNITKSRVFTKYGIKV